MTKKRNSIKKKTSRTKKKRNTKIKKQKEKDLDISVDIRIGEREYNEDRYVVISNLVEFEHLALFVVCDGHGGDKCVNHTIKNFPLHVQSMLVDKANADIKRPNLKLLLTKAVEATIQDWDRHVLGKGISIVDEENRIGFFEDVDISEFENMGNDSGTTLTCCIFNRNNRTVYMCNLGDSRTMVYTHDGRPITATVDHSVPERAPVIKGFEVEFVDGRVNGMLAMTASIGDHCPELSGIIRRIPDVSSVNIGDGSATIILCSDGLTDIMSTQDIFLNPRKNAKGIIDSIREPLHDNTTCLMIKLSSK